MQRHKPAWPDQNHRFTAQNVSAIAIIVSSCLPVIRAAVTGKRIPKMIILGKRLCTSDDKN